jgi:hypothetical protein
MLYQDYSEEDIIQNQENICFPILLKNKKLSIAALEKLIGHINLRQVILTQNLTPEFIAKYILNEKYYEEDDEKTITIGLIIKNQKISKDEISRAQQKQKN